MNPLQQLFSSNSGEPSQWYEAHRSGIGITNLTGMGFIRVSGKAARTVLNHEFTANLEYLPEKAIRLSLMLASDGAIMTDLQIYNNFDHYFLTVAESRKSIVLERLNSLHSADFVVEDLTDQRAFIAIEGPEIERVTEPLVGLDSMSLRLLCFDECQIESKDAIVSRIGFTGEFGFLLIVPRDSGAALVERMRKIAPSAVLCSAEIYDPLWLEARSFNFDKDIPNQESAISAGLHWMIDFRKEEFVGRSAVLEEVENPPKVKLIGVYSEEGCTEFQIPGALYEYDRVCGYLAHWAYSPHSGRVIGLAYIDWDRAWVGLDFELQTAQGRLKLKTVTTPFLITKSNKRD